MRRANTLHQRMQLIVDYMHDTALMEEWAPLIIWVHTPGNVVDAAGSVLDPVLKDTILTEFYVSLELSFGAYRLRLPPELQIDMQQAHDSRSAMPCMEIVPIGAEALVKTEGMEEVDDA